MKQLICKLAAAAILGLGLPAGAAIDFTGGSGSYSATWSGSQVIADYPGVGVGYALNFDDAAYNQITDISVTFKITGGWNGDLYVYLSHGDGLAVLLNRVGTVTVDDDGYATAGFNTITLSMNATTDIHGVPNPTTEGGPYAADGRVNYYDTGRPHQLGVFDGSNPNGAWTLFFGDLATVNTSTLESWSVDITAVPEPTTWALIMFGAVGGMLGVARMVRRRWCLAEKDI